MHELEPFFNWIKYYDSSADDRSPFYGKEYNYDLLSETIYNYYINPAWDSIGSETLYIKILYTDYHEGYTIIEMMGEWNDAIHNDIMVFKRNIIELLLHEGVNKFILIGEKVFNFHGSDDSYYEEWFDDVEDGWIAIVSLPEFVQEEFRKYHLDQYINIGGTLQIDKWRTMIPSNFYDVVDKMIQRRLN